MEEKMLCKLTSGDTVYHYNKSIIIKFSGKRAVLSTAILNGGYRENISAVLNHDAKAAPGMGCQLRAPTYEEHMKLIAEEAGLDAEHTTGIATAANMENVSIVSQNYGNLSLTAIVTAGIETNGGRVGIRLPIWKKMRESQTFRMEPSILYWQLTGNFFHTPWQEALLP